MTDKQLCQYIRNTGQTPLRVADFDDDWEPAGEMYRDQLLADGLILISDGTGEAPAGIVLTAAGEALL